MINQRAKIISKTLSWRTKLYFSTSKTDRVNEAWKRIEQWYSKHRPQVKMFPGVSDAEIHGLEAHIKLPLPEELKISLHRHNGMPPVGWPKGILLSVDGIKNEWTNWTDRFNAGAFNGEKFKPEEDSGEKIQKCWWSPSWIPIDSDGIGNGSCIDLKPGPRGTPGQIIDMDQEIGPNGPIFQDFVDYLESVAALMESGKCDRVGSYYISKDLKEVEEVKCCWFPQKKSLERVV